MSVLKVMLVIEVFLVATYGFPNLKLSTGYLKNYFHPHTPTVTHYARQTLCKDRSGKMYFYTALKQKFCDVRRKFTAELVSDLCRRQDYLLDKWVEELFDVNGDGYISHHEKQLYRSKDD